MDPEVVLFLFNFFLSCANLILVFIVSILLMEKKMKEAIKNNKEELK